MFVQENSPSSWRSAFRRLAHTVVATSVLCGGLLVAMQALARAPTFADINPDSSSELVAVLDESGNSRCPVPCPSGGSGGRVNGLAVVAEHPMTYFAASELGGLFKTSNGGDSWFHLDGHIPSRTWDVATTADGQKVYATSFYDGRVDSLAGIEVSGDGGLTWTRPTIVPVSSCTAVRKAQPSAYGISIRPDAPDEVLVGTNCGIQRTTDGGANWTAGLGVDGVVWDVVALDGGRTYYACSEAGFLSSSDGTTWTAISQPAPDKAYCRLAVSPDEHHVVFAVFAVPGFSDYLVARAGEFFESDDGGKNWSSIPSLPGGKVADPKNSADYWDPIHHRGGPKRNPFVATNKRSKGFDLWLGGGHLHQVPCITPDAASPGGSVRCSQSYSEWSDTFTDANGDFSKAHGDSGDLLFDPTQSVDACPTFYSSDGGIYKNSNTASPECHAKASFQPANAGVHALLLQGMAGVNRAGAWEDIYLALQDCGLFHTGNAEATKPLWAHAKGGDANDVVADETRAVVFDGGITVFDASRLDSIRSSNPDLASCASHGVADVIDQYGPDQYALAINTKKCGTDIGIRLTNDVESDPLGEPLGAWPTTAGPCHVRVSKTDTDTQVYALAGTCNWNGDLGNPPDQLWRYANNTWTRVEPPAPGTGFSIFAVAPSDPNRLYASVIGTDSGMTVPLGMYRTTDGGATWAHDKQLTDLMLGVVGGRRTFVTCIEDALDGAQAGPIAQPTLVAFDPLDPATILAGGRESGVFLSRDSGETWTLLTDPFTPGTSGVPHLPRPYFAHFVHRPFHSLAIFVGTMGRGVWRVDLGDAVGPHFVEPSSPWWQVLSGFIDDSPGVIINPVTGESKPKPMPPYFRDVLREMFRYESARASDMGSELEARKQALRSINRIVEHELYKLETRRSVIIPPRAILRRGQLLPSDAE